jgi:hypothetical protein
LLIGIPMVQVLGHYAARFSVRAKDMTLDFSLVWFGIGLALIAAVFLAFIPRLPSLDVLRATAWPAVERASPEEIASAAFASSPSCRSPRHSCCLPDLPCS